MSSRFPVVNRALPVLAPGGTVVCLATGPSLMREDVEFCRGKATVIAINDAHRLAPWADVLYSSDRYWWKHYHGVPEFRGLKATIEYRPDKAAEEVLKLVPMMYVLRNTGDNGLETRRDGVRTCQKNSGGAALNLAVHLGAKVIILLGYDMSAKGMTHFFGNHPYPLANGHHFSLWQKGFQTMRDPLNALGIRVVNCSRRTALKTFERGTLADALSVREAIAS